MVKRHVSPASGPAVLEYEVQKMFIDDDGAGRSETVQGKWNLLRADQVRSGSDSVEVQLPTHRLWPPW